MIPRTRRIGSYLIAIALLTAAFFLLQPSAELKARRELIGKITSNSSLKLYEGLPHPMFEAELYKSELTTKPHTRIDSYYFYERPLFADEELENELRALSEASGTYRKFSGEKKCGGFHPDFALRWSNGEGAVMILICFHCEEAWLFGETLSVRVDLSESASKSLAKLLSRTRGQRPTQKRGAEAR